VPRTAGERLGAYALVGPLGAGGPGSSGRTSRPAATRARARKLVGFHEDVHVESLGISPDGSRVTIALMREDRSLMLAEDVPGVR
jgi:hypothetical protein